MSAGTHGSPTASWVPTFPNAKYVMARKEFDHWRGIHDSGADSPHALAFGDSILPVVKTGQSMLVGDDFALEDGLWFEGYPGHTPGNVVIHAKSGGERGLFIGDVLHHPLQCLKPEWSTAPAPTPTPRGSAAPGSSRSTPTAAR